MPHSRSWFSANAAGKTVSLSEPLDTTWEIVAKINERVEQYSDTKQLSIASAKFLVHHVDAPPDKGIAYMRVIKQIPSVLAEGTDDSSRGREAKQFVPSELNAYHALMRKHSHNTPHLFAWETGEQEDSGQVPGGSITYIVFEKLPGIALGTEFRATAFWEQPPATRELIRRTLFVEYNAAWNAGILPMVDGPRSAIWNESKQTIRFAGFRTPAFMDSPTQVLDQQTILEVFKVDDGQAPIDLVEEEEDESEPFTAL